ncbi:response regulator [Luteibacter sp.]|uniref:response regulator n=1 Tax=Luteibacter sp. TaxID=1886636 RepID=UPI003F7D3214
MATVTRLDGHRILVVEDNEMIAELWASVLEDHGAQIIGPVASVKDALVAIDRHLPQSAVLDVHLVDGVSFPVARELAARAIPYVIVASFDPRDLPADLGMPPFLCKPTSLASLVEVVGTMQAAG